MAEIGEPERRRVLVPDETPAPAPVEPVPAPKREKVPADAEKALLAHLYRIEHTSYGDVLRKRLTAPASEWFTFREMFGND